jgi:hypothetical protein
MTRFLAAAFLTSTIAVTLGACGNDNADVSYASGGYATMCGAYTTCGSCTPVDGCGWCFSGATGTCAPDPDSCTDASEFTWTWNPSGCPAVPTVVDAGTSDSPATSTPVEAIAPRDAQYEMASD